ncbi:MAG: zinc-finger domain-containing protein [Pseudomonadota bacterium]
MAITTIPHFCNDIGVEKILIGVKEFKCMGAKAPFDHPHVFLDMGSDHEIICPYCSTLYVYDKALGPLDTDPPTCLVTADEAA